MKKHRKGGQGAAAQQAAATPGRKTTDEMCDGDRDTGIAGNAPDRKSGPSAAAPLPVLHTVTHFVARNDYVSNWELL